MIPIKIIHIIPSLNSGGAETMLYKLVKYRDQTNSVEIITLVNGGFYADQIKEMGVQVHELNIKELLVFPKKIVNILPVIKNADIIQTWMYHADIFGLIVGKFIFRKKIVWGIRRSYLKKELMKAPTYYLAKVSSILSPTVDGIISCTRVGMKSHQDFGYRNDNFIVIPNGFEITDTVSGKPKDLPNTEEGTILLNVARWEPLKDHYNLLKSAQLLKEKGITFRLLLVGKGMENDNKELKRIISKFKLEKEVVLLGVRKDVLEIMNFADIYLSSSISEGFPNVIGEAMATGTYCIATDAGDTKYILNGYGTVVPIKSPDSIANAVVEVLKKEDEEIEKQRVFSKKHIREEYAIKKIVDEYEDFYKNISKN